MKINGYEIVKAEDGTWTIHNPFTKGDAEIGYPTRKDAKADAAALHPASWYDNHPKDGSAQNLCDHAYDYCAYAPA